MSRGTPAPAPRRGLTVQGAVAVTHGQRPQERPQRRPQERRYGWWVRRALSALGDSCAFACVALLGCLALVAVGALVSLLWAFVVDR